MTILCNRRHATEDSAYALYAEMLRSACVDYACIGGDCQEPETHMFHLPKALTVKYPLRLSVAHKHHGRQMLSGWPEEPSDVSQRVDEENNILMETWLENWTKLDLDKKFYSQLRDVFRRSVVTSELYDPNINLPSDTDQTLADVSDVDYNSEVVRGPTTKMTEDANADDEGMPPLPAAPRSGSTFSPLRFNLQEAAYEDIEGDDLVGKTSIFYGQTLVVNGQTGYAHNDGNFRTTDGSIVGKFGDDGSLYPLGGKFLPRPKQYPGPCMIAKMVYHIQVPSMVDNNSPLYDVILIKDDDQVGFATTSGDFVTEDGAIVGRLEADSGLISDTADDTVGNAFSVQDDGYKVASQRLAELPLLQLVFTPHDEQVTELTRVGLQARIQSLVPPEHGLDQQSLGAQIDQTNKMICGLPHKDNGFRDCANDQILACIRETGVIDVNGNEIPLQDIESNDDNDYGSEGDGDGGEGGEGDGKGEASDDGDNSQGASVRAVRRPFSEQRDELSNLVNADHAMNNIVLQERDEEGTVRLYYPSRTGRLMLSDAASQPGQNVMSRTIAVFSTDSPNLYDIRGPDNSIIASVKRADGKSPWTLANDTTDSDALEEEEEEQEEE
ncbi:hypothetical protein D6C90_07080 [Aureobasidium pullulans]|uniref:Uncharacterized protein n=1 Tax=Aureobasidium pullulans TaxID=5580 RepID=A0A4S8YGT8_AURPU|nr:hypothetical protein D6D21_02245 [Aureobasidium pullulans]THW94827.1 hypothetical protein D6D15_01785 [Aureobasidium pullulans]THZ36225.1 hypothetical protein D6C90_07080 [Aureobasidium pullulans]